MSQLLTEAGYFIMSIRDRHGRAGAQHQRSDIMLEIPQPCFLPVLKATEQAGLHPWDPGTADVVAPHVWMADLLYSRHDLPVLCPLVGS